MLASYDEDDSYQARKDYVHDEYDGRKLSQHQKVVAIGEIGLDYYWDIPKEPQKLIFEKQLELFRTVKMKSILKYFREQNHQIMKIVSWHH